jgi:pseudouridine synthase
MTNDGDLANAILHPKNKIPKTYLAKIDGFLDDREKSKLERGIRLEDGITAPAKVRRVRTLKANSWIEITIHEGRKRQVRRMFERVKHPVSKLVRTKVNGLSLGNLKPGEFRYLSPDEVKKLKSETMKGKGGKQ